MMKISVQNLKKAEVCNIGGVDYQVYVKFFLWYFLQCSYAKHVPLSLPIPISLNVKCLFHCNQTSCVILLSFVQPNDATLIMQKMPFNNNFSNKFEVVSFYWFTIITEEGNNTKQKQQPQNRANSRPNPVQSGIAFISQQKRLKYLKHF